MCEVAFIQARDSHPVNPSIESRCGAHHHSHQAPAPLTHATGKPCQVAVQASLRSHSSRASSGVAAALGCRSRQLS